MAIENQITVGNAQTVIPALSPAQEEAAPVLPMVQEYLDRGIALNRWWAEQKYPTESPSGFRSSGKGPVSPDPELQSP
jgi:hypothetical protein